MSNTVFIYVLIDPRDNQIRYVGQSERPERRYKDHLFEMYYRSRKVNWIKNLKSFGLRPQMRILAECPKEQAQIVERDWYDKLTAEGHQLFNSPHHFVKR